MQLIPSIFISGIALAGADTTLDTSGPLPLSGGAGLIFIHFWTYLKQILKTMNTPTPIAQSPAPINLADVIAHIESSGNPHAMRFEPATYTRISVGTRSAAQNAILNKIIQVNKCSLGTALMIYSTSFGLFQIMGFNLYDPSHSALDVDIVTYSDDPILQVSKFSEFVSRETIDFTPQDLAQSIKLRNEFALTYNGSMVYASAIVSSLKFFNIPVGA